MYVYVYIYIHVKRNCKVFYILYRIEIFYNIIYIKNHFIIKDLISLFNFVITISSIV